MDLVIVRPIPLPGGGVSAETQMSSKQLANGTLTVHACAPVHHPSTCTCLPKIGGSHCGTGSCVHTEPSPHTSRKHWTTGTLGSSYFLPIFELKNFSIPTSGHVLQESQPYSSPGQVFHSYFYLSELLRGGDSVWSHAVSCKNFCLYLHFVVKHPHVLAHLSHFTRFTYVISM